MVSKFLQFDHVWRYQETVKKYTVVYYLPILLFTGSIGSIQDWFLKSSLTPHFFLRDFSLAVLHELFIN